MEISRTVPTHLDHAHARADTTDDLQHLRSGSHVD
jgi:hypothetical protein